MPKKRFDLYEPLGDIGRPELTGLVPNQYELDYATPNLTRNESVLLVGSNTSSKEALVVRLSWHPNHEKKLVTLTSQLTLMIGDSECYEFKQTEPQVSTVYPDRILKFGSRFSKLRLLIASPYRRMRLLFNGTVKRRASSTAKSEANDKDDDSLFLKLNCVINPISSVYDFLDNFDEKCAKQIYDSSELSALKISYDEAIKRLLIQDRHEQKFRFNGEYLLIEQRPQQTRTKKKIALWGFHARHFLEHENSSTTKPRRLYAIMNNGQSFHIGTNYPSTTRDETARDIDGKQGKVGLDFGYTTFETIPIGVPIDKPFVGLNFNQFNQDTEKFELTIHGQGKTFECYGKKRGSNQRHWFDVETNGVPGWAWFDEDQPADVAVSVDIDGSDHEAISIEHTQDKPLVVSIKDSVCSSDQLVGAKAASLNHLRQIAATLGADETSNYSVPEGFVLTKHAYELVQSEEHIKSAIDQLKKASVADDDEDNSHQETFDLKLECKKVADLIKGSKLHPRILQEIENFEQFKLSKDASYAVRSSSWGEDEDDMSAAGQLTTVLNVSGLEALAEAVMACFASKFSYENIQYKRQHGLPLDMPMAVVIQEMVACEKAGVTFTCEPTLADDSQIIITANYGLGESVVSAQADPDSIVVRVHANDELKIEKTQIGRKNVIIGHGQQDQDKTKCCLSDDEILKVARVGRRLRDTLKCPLDIEWGFLEGQLKLFQARPITGLDSCSDEEMLHECERPSQAERAFFTRANIGEVMPYAIKPLTLTYAVFSWGIMGNRMYMKLNRAIEFTPHCTMEVYYENYHAYFNLRCGSLLGAEASGEKSLVKKAMEIGFFGHEMETQTDIVEASKGFTQPPNIYQGLRFDLLTFWLKLFPLRVVNKERFVLEKLRDKVENLELATGYGDNKLLGLYNQLTAIFRNMEQCWLNHIFVITFASQSNVVLSAILSKYITDPMKLSSASNKFLAISEDVISAGIPRGFAKMAKLIKDLGAEEVEKFVSMSSSEALAYIRNQESSSDPVRIQLAKEFQDFIKKFGHRSYNEFELAQKPWRERPEEIVESIKSNCVKLDLGSETTTPSRPSTIDSVIESLGVQLSSKDRFYLKYQIVPKCQKMLAARELTKDILVLYHDIARIASRLLAKEMYRSSRIPDTDVFYYLYFDELLPLVRDHQPSIVSQAIRRRNFFGKTFDQLWMYDEIIRDTTPKHLRPSKQLDSKLMEAPKLYGTPASSGRVRGKICLINGFKELERVRGGSILLTHSTDIGFSPIFPMIVGIITEVGGLISHGAVVAREYGLPSVIGIPDITLILQDGEEIILDADNGMIIRLDKTNEDESSDASNQKTE